jgi:signal transduction histidine kinase
MDFNLATTISFCAAAISMAVGVLGAYLGQRSATRHFRFVAVAGFAAAVYSVTDAVLAGRMTLEATMWCGRLSGVAVGVHGAAWIAAIAAWDRRPISRLERGMAIVSVAGGIGCFLPDVAVHRNMTYRPVHWLGIAYHDPEISAAGVVLVSLCYLAHVVATMAAVRMVRRNARAKAVALGLAVFCVVIPLDALSSVHVLDLPYLADPAIAFVLLSIGSVVVRDAAETAEKTAELERARVALAERENLAALGQLAAVMAHEVRNPVAIIFGAVTSLRRSARTNEDLQLLGIVSEEADRLKQLVLRLLDAVRPFELQYTSRPVRHVIQTAVTQVTTSSGIAETQVELVNVPNEDVECDEVLLVQAISNLVQNAIIANGRRSPVHVRASIDESIHPIMLCVEIADDGDGVPPESRDRLFTPFFTTRATGTGLGLALVKRIAGAHGGRVDYAPPADGGASFVLRVPLRARDAVPRRLVGNEVR